MSDRDIELYLHIPFCIRKCAYCDFLSFSGERKTQEAYSNALIREIQAVGNREYSVSSIYIGGGTPSILQEDSMVAILDAIRNNFKVLSWAEISIECNPGTVTAQKLHAYHQAGMNRISFGLQSAHNHELEKLGRIHTWEMFLESYQLARKEGFSNINVDIMSGLPGQTREEYLDTLRKVIRLNLEHVSAYSLILEEGTPFYQMYYNTELNQELPDEEEERRMYWHGRKFLEEQGFSCYEISNYARPSKECRHNLGYWTGKEYLGIGLGASSYFNGKRFHNTDSMKEYLQMSDKPDRIRIEEEIVTKKRAMEEVAFLGLRLTKGIDMMDFEKRFECRFQDVYGDVMKRFLSMGFLAINGPYLCLTEKGIDVSNQIMAEFLLDGE